MDTLFTVQNIRLMQRAAICATFAMALTACGGGNNSAATTPAAASTEEQVIALHAKLDSGQITEEAFISQLAALAG